jgi:hypothetical protein
MRPEEDRLGVTPLRPSEQNATRTDAHMQLATVAGICMYMRNCIFRVFPTLNSYEPVSLKRWGPEAVMCQASKTYHPRSHLNFQLCNMPSFY